ncbi:capsid protein [Blackfly DNA Virus 14]|nr:capsid protein [Blackfly DNA Virus 14]
MKRHGRKTSYRKNSKRSFKRSAPTSRKRRFSNKPRRYTKSRRSNRRTSKSRGKTYGRRVAQSSLMKSLTPPYQYNNNDCHILKSPPNVTYWTIYSGPLFAKIVENLYVADVASATIPAVPAPIRRRSFTNKLLCTEWTNKYAWTNTTTVPGRLTVYTCRAREAMSVLPDEVLRNGFWLASGNTPASVLFPDDQPPMMKDPSTDLFMNSMWCQNFKILSTKEHRILPGQTIKKQLTVRNRHIDLQKYQGFGFYPTGFETQNPQIMRGELILVAVLKGEVQIDITGNVGLPSVQLAFEGQAQVTYHVLSATSPFYYADGTSSYGYIDKAVLHTVAEKNHIIQPMSGLIEEQQATTVVAYP